MTLPNLPCLNDALYLIAVPEVNKVQAWLLFANVVQSSSPVFNLTKKLIFKIRICSGCPSLVLFWPTTSQVSIETYFPKRVNKIIPTTKYLFFLPYLIFSHQHFSVSFFLRTVSSPNADETLPHRTIKHKASMLWGSNGQLACNFATGHTFAKTVVSRLTHTAGFISRGPSGPARSPKTGFGPTL